MQHGYINKNQLISEVVFNGEKEKRNFNANVKRGNG